MLKQKYLKDRADVFLYSEILDKLKEEFNISRFRAKRMLLKSDFLYHLAEKPYQTHHRDATGWAYEVMRQQAPQKE